MSHDAWMEEATEGVVTEVADIGNYTRNVSPMWRKAMAVAAGKPMAIQDTDGMTGADALPLFNAAMSHMALNPQEYEPLNPENGWGDYRGAMQFVAKCATACEANPSAVLRWSV